MIWAITEIIITYPVPGVKFVPELGKDTPAPKIYRDCTPNTPFEAKFENQVCMCEG